MILATELVILENYKFLKMIPEIGVSYLSHFRSMSFF